MIVLGLYGVVKKVVKDAALPVIATFCSVVLLGVHPASANGLLALRHVLHNVDGSLLTRDYYTKLPEYSHLVVIELASLASRIGVPFGVFFGVGKIVALFGIWYGIWRIIGILARDKLVQCVAFTILYVILFLVWGSGLVGGNTLFYFGQSVIATMAFPLALWTFWACMKQRWGWAGLALGLTVMLHPLVGVNAGVFFMVVALVDIYQSRDWKVAKHTLQGLFISLLVAMPVVIRVLASQEAVSPYESARIVETLAIIRAPWHYLPSTWSIVKYTNAIVTLLTGLYFVQFLRVQSRIKHAITLYTLLIVALCVVCYLFTEVWPSATIMKFQFYRATVLVQLLLVIAIVVSVAKNFSLRKSALYAFFLGLGTTIFLPLLAPWVRKIRYRSVLLHSLVLQLAAFTLVGVVAFFLLGGGSMIFPEYFSGQIDVLYERWQWIVVIFLVLVLMRFVKKSLRTTLVMSVLLIVVLSVWSHRGEEYPVVTFSSQPVGHPLEEASAWIRDNTHPGDFFVIPPDLEGFSALSQRSATVEIKAIPFDNARLLEYRDALEYMAGSKITCANNVCTGSDVGSAWLKRLPAEIVQIAIEENAQYVLLHAQGASLREGTEELLGRPVYADSTVRIYRVQR